MTQLYVTVIKLPIVYKC